MFEWVINTSIMFTELPLLQRPAAVARAGFTAMESWWPFGSGVPDEREVDAFVTAIGDAGVRLHALNLWSGDHAGGDRGVLSHPHRANEFAESVHHATDIARRLGCRYFNTLYGLPDERWSSWERRRTAVENLEMAAHALGQLGGTLLLEPLSGFEDYPLRTPTQCLDLMDQVSVSNIGLLFDVYHLAANGMDPSTELAAAYARIEHVQLADYPGRHQPGSGEINFPGILRQLKSLGWNRPISLEYMPSGPTAESFSWLAQTALLADSGDGA